ncbi:MAG: hypothetical protein C1943_10805 [Halochromatium sp.]|nr:hypothetical protein [Halochromatium sp.]
MKIFKQKQQSIIPRPFLVQGRDRLAVGILVFFDLDDPQNPLSEQDLWKAVPKQLGTQATLDQGLPKPRGEALVFGSYFAPRGTRRQASTVAVRVGPIEKRLDVFGDRFWEAGRITRPLDFQEMPLRWERAFGGAGDPRNPLGKGLKPILGPGNHLFHPLPNLELPAQTIGSPGDRPEPAGLGALDSQWSPRAEKRGTYDARWKRERWPGYPDDMDWSVFNLAPSDQQLKGFFQGGEPLRIAGMHPDRALIESRLPAIRMRCFVTLNGEYRPHVFPSGPLPSSQVRETDEFREVPTHLETVWLFPGIMRGLVLFRGVTDIADDEMADVLRILVRPEPLDTEPQPIEHYRDLQIRELDRGVNIDPAPLQRAQQQVTDAKRRIGNIPKQIDAIRRSSMGQTPSMPPPDPEEEAIKHHRMLDRSLALVDRMEASKAAVEAKLGVKSGIDNAIFAHHRQHIAELRSNLERTTKELAATKAKIIQGHDEGIKSVNAHLKARPPALQAHSKLDPEQPVKPLYPFKSAYGPWHEAGYPFVVRCRKDLELDEEAQAELHRLGLEPETLRRHWLGLSAQARDWPGTEFGLDPDQQVALPAGLVLPRFDGPKLNRILVRPKGPDDSYSLPLGETLASGSDESALFLESATLIDLPGLAAADAAPVLIVASELEGLYAEQEVGDFCSVLAAESATTALPQAATKALKAAPVVLVALPERYAASAALSKQLRAWQLATPQAAPLEMLAGSTLFETRTKEPVRDWVLRHLPKEMAAAHESGIQLPEPGKHLSPGFMKGFKLNFPDLGAIIPGVIGELRDFHRAKFADMERQRDTLLQDARDRLQARGLDPGLVDQPPPEGPTDFRAGAQAAAQKIRERIQALKQTGHLSAEHEAKMTEAADWCERSGAEGQERWDAGMRQLAEKQQELEQGVAQLKNHQVPEAMKAKFKEAGMDLDKMRPLTREQVIALRERGESPDQADLSGVDLSELDLSGADFSRCKLGRTAFRKAKLDGARFTKAMGQGADFSDASLVGAEFGQAMLKEAIFKQANLQQANFDRAMINGAVLDGADLRAARFHMSMLKQASMKGADFRAARFELTTMGGDATKADFSGIRTKQLQADRMTLDGASFAGATLFRTMFQRSKGEKVNFRDGDLRKLRLAIDSELPGADFSGADLRGAGLRQSDLSGADFSRARLDTAVIDNCYMPGAKLYKASARRTRLRNNNLEGADLRFVNLFSGSVGKTRLVQADLRGAHLYGADLYKVVMGKTRLDGINLRRTLLEGNEDLLK